MEFWPQTTQTLKKGNDARRLAFRADFFWSNRTKHSYTWSEPNIFIQELPRPYTGPLYWALVYTMMPEAGMKLCNHALDSTILDCRVLLVQLFTLDWALSRRPLRMGPESITIEQTQEILWRTFGSHRFQRVAETKRNLCQESKRCVGWKFA